MSSVLVRLSVWGSVDLGYTAVFTIDTRTIDTIAPASELTRAGFEPVGQTMYELSDGTLREFSFGLARIEFLGEITAGRVIFGSEDAKPCLGMRPL